MGITTFWPPVPTDPPVVEVATGTVVEVTVDGTVDPDGPGVPSEVTT
jgi:hypothetical protein